MEPERSGDSQPSCFENCWHNNYDELKNQWGWNGYTTKKLAPCRIMANLIALICNWWSLYVRHFDEEHHREAICADLSKQSAALSPLRSGSTRPALLSGAGEHPA